MSEQEIDLDTAIQLFQLVENYNEYAEGLRQVLTRVHTQEELDRARTVIEDKKQHMIDNNPEFNAVMRRRKSEAKQRAEQNRAIHKAKMAETKAKAMSSVRGATSDRDVDDWVAGTKFKTVDPEELEKKLDDKLGCPNPKCEDHGKNRHNVMNNVPRCMLCYHRLVSKSEFKDYNRAYWRRYNKRRKKKKK